MKGFSYSQYTKFSRMAIVISACCLGTSCGGPRRAGPVDAEKARQAFKVVLDSWKGGESLSDFRKRSPSITVQDMDWLAGIKLVTYEFSGNERLDAANLHCSVKLLLRDAEGRETEKDVTYVIGTDPVTTVFREMMM